MNFKHRKILYILFLAPLLMAFQCEDDLEDIIKTNNYKVGLTTNKVFLINDTIWIEGRVSSMAFNETKGDSIFNDNNQGDDLSVFKFITPTEHSNTEEALDKFSVVVKKGSFSSTSSCENYNIIVDSELENNNLFYSYKIGLVPKQEGDFVIDFIASKMSNSQRNLNIVDKYQIERHPNQVGFNRCGTLSWLYLEDSKNEYFFTVE